MKQNNTGLFSQLLLWQKLAILGLIAVVLVVLPFGFYLYGAQRDADTAGQELAGIKPVATMLKIVQLTQQHRGLSSLVVGGETSADAARAAKAKEINDTLAVFEAVLKKDLAEDQGLVKAWQTANEKWQGLLGQVQGATKPSVLESFKLHTGLIADYFLMLDKLADFYKLSLDPEADSYHLMSSSIYAVPKLTEFLGQLRGLGSGILAQKKADAQQHVKLSSILMFANDYKDEAFRQLQKTLASDPGRNAKLGPVINDAQDKVDNAIKLTQVEILEKTALTFDSKSYFNEYTTAIDAVFSMNTAALGELQRLLEERKKSLLTEQVTISGGIVFLSLLGAVIAYYISRSITQPVKHLVGVMQQLSMGDSSVRSGLQSRDEIGIMGRQFDQMVDQREAVSSQIQKENETLNNSVIELLYAVAKLSQKDLTAKATVSEDVTGPVADALNLLAAETAKVLNRVVQIANEVAAVSNQVQSQSALVIDVAAEEKQEVEQAANELGDASLAMRTIAQLAFSCNEAAQKAINNTNRAQASVTDTVQGITTIRDTIRETEKRIKRLGERSQEIGGVVNLINEIAERTHILALNASMHAASAGEAGRGFAVVANEVQKLAENSREATSKIAALVNNIQVETADTVVTMNDAISQVVRGTDLAQQAGDEMRETRDTTAELVQLVQQIAESSTTQSATSLRLLERAGQIQKATTQTYEQLQAQGEQTERLVDLSNTLVSSVSVFTLPTAAA